MIRDRQEGGVGEQDCRSAQQRFADHDQYHAHVVRVADVAIKAGDDQLARGVVGAGVPRPRRTKSMKQATITDSPAKSGTRPEYDARPKSKCGPKLEATNASGRSTSTVPGTKIVNRSVRLLPPNDHAQRPARAKEGAEA